MKKAKLKIEKKNDIYLGETGVENLFINDFLPHAPGDYVKVYLFGLMYAEHDIEMNVETLSRDLSLSVDEVLKAIKYWEKRGLLQVNYSRETGAYELEYKSLIQKLYGLNKSESADGANAEGVGEETGEGLVADFMDSTKSADSADLGEESRDRESSKDYKKELAQDERLSQFINESIRTIYVEYEEASGRTLSPREMEKIASTIKTANVAPDVLSYAVKYCKEIEKYSVDYICSVAVRWTGEGCRTIGDAKRLISKNSKMNEYFRKVFHEVGFTRMPSPADRELMAKWIEEWGFNIGEVLAACRKTAGKREPSLNYVNKILENKMLEVGGIKTNASGSPAGSAQGGQTAAGNQEHRARVSKKVLADFYESLRKDAEKRQDARIDEACMRIPELRRVYEEINELNYRISQFDFVNSSKADRDELREKSKSLEHEKRTLLKDNGYAEDYLEKKYLCEFCKDTGTTDDGRVCVCTAKRAEEAFRWITEKNKH